jgi:hypothetical protein
VIYTLYTFNRWNSLYALWITCSLDLQHSSGILIKGTREGPYTLFQVRSAPMWLSSIWGRGLGRGQSLCSRGASQMALGIRRGFRVIYVDNSVDNSCPQLIQKLSTCEQAVSNLWISPAWFFSTKTQKLSTACPQIKRRPQLPSTPTMFEHELIITPFG